MLKVTTGETDMSEAALAGAFAARGLRVDDSALTRALYASDASLYRVPPMLVGRPRDAGEVAAFITCAAELGVPVTARGAGTSCAGNAVGTGLVLDLRDLGGITVDATARTAVVGPGTTLAALNRVAGAHGLRCGPDPSTASRATIGGMVGNNACGPRALGYGRTSEALAHAHVVLADGREVSTDDAVAWTDAIAVVEGALGVVRTEFGRFSRQIAGYALEHLLPERRNIAAFLCGTEGTLGVLTTATLRLVALPRFTSLVTLGFSTLADAADAIAPILAERPTAVEGLDQRILDVVAARGQHVPDMPAGPAFLMVEIGGDHETEVRARAERVRSLGSTTSFVTTGAPARELWKLRAAGAGLAAVALEQPAHAGWEDAAVPIEHLGAYLRGFEALLTEYGLHALPYGHLGEGCVHARIDFPLTNPDGPQRYRAFIEDAARLAAGLGGSATGEHGDGRARSELLALQYSPMALTLFAAVKHALDPDGLLNPGIIVDPQPLDANLRLAQPPCPTAAAIPGLEKAHMCTGVGACVSIEPSAGSGMCPSYRVTGREQDSTRGRARGLQEVLDGRLGIELNSSAIGELLENCLACKACRAECPTGVDLAELKSIALNARWSGKLRPRWHYALGWLPRWARIVVRSPWLAPLANLALGAPGLRQATAALAGIDPSRSLPRFEPRRISIPQGGSGTPVYIWADSFSPAFAPGALSASVSVLVAAGFAPIATPHACCGLTWITTGQRHGARKQLLHALDVLHPIAAAGHRIVGIEPSCLAVWRADGKTLVGDDPRFPIVATAMRSLAELLVEARWLPPSLADVEVLAQPHCHSRALAHWPADAAVLTAAGAHVTVVDGCCGMAGSFGMEPGHADISRAVADLNLTPALAAHPDAIVLADGFSCRTQVAELAPGRPSQTLAELLAEHLPTASTPERNGHPVGERH